MYCKEQYWNHFLLSSLVTCSYNKNRTNLIWTLSNMFVSILYWGARNKAAYVVWPHQY